MIADTKNVIIRKDIPAGNIQCVSVQGKQIELDVEMRDSAGNWFYWNFSAEFPEAGDYTFHFIRRNTVGSRAAAVSHDGGLSWRWLGAECRVDAETFIYHCEQPEKVILCFGMQYLQKHFDLFRNRYFHNPFLKVGELCRTPKGRSVELVTVRGENPKYTVLLTSRHHCCEMMANYVLQGILQTALAYTPFAEEFRRHIEIIAVPFTDKDGVEDGDQGKNRRPHDHARDYVENPIFREPPAIMKLIAEKRPVFVMDLHCPWAFGGCNETLEIPGSSDPDNIEQEALFSSILERHVPACSPYFASDNVLYGTLWNTGDNYTEGVTVKQYAIDYNNKLKSNGEKPFLLCSCTLETPYANARETTYDVSAMEEQGRAVAESIFEFLQAKGCF